MRVQQLIETSMSWNYDDYSWFCADTGCFVGAGIGLGLLTSLFATGALIVIYLFWNSCHQQTEWDEVTIFTLLCRTLFALPFLASPAFIGLFVGIWLITVIGYLMAFVYIGCFWCYKRDERRIENPTPNNKQNNNNYKPLTNVKLDTYDAGNNNNNDNHEIKQWLNEIGLNEYYETLKDQGYETVDDILTITENDLKELGIKKQMHVKKIMKKIYNTN